MRILKIILGLWFFLFSIGCEEDTCENSISKIMEYDLNLIFIKERIGPYRFSVLGIDPKTNLEVAFHSNDIFFSPLWDDMEKNDTIIKIRGVAEILLLKEKKIVKYSYTCNGEKLDMLQRSINR